MPFSLKSPRSVQRIGFLLAAILVLFVSGCVTADNRSPEEIAKEEEKFDQSVSKLRETDFGPAKLLSEHPRVEVRSKISQTRVEALPIVQKDGLAFPARMGPSVGYPASLQIANTDSVVVEITDIRIRRRTPRLVGDYESLLGADPIILKPDEKWEGTFIVSRKKGWFKIELQSAAPPGWTAIQGEGTREVYFQETTNSSLASSEYQVEIQFWNLGESEASFRFWISDEDQPGVPQTFEYEDTIVLKPGKARLISFSSSTKDWNLFTAPVNPAAKAE